MRGFLASALISLLVFGAAMEIGARWLDPGDKDPPRYLSMSRGLPELPQLIRDKRIGRLKYYDYQLYAVAPFKSATVNMTDYHSSRLTPASVPRSEANMIVWTFGGSTMQNFETTDELSIANTIAKYLVRNGLRPRVENFGIGSFQSSLELVQFSHLLATVPTDERPSVAIFYDGFNDAYHAYSFGAGAIQRDLSDKLAMLVEGRSGPLALYAVSSWLAKHSRAWAMLVHPRIQARMFGHPAVGASKDNLDKAVAVYASNVEMAESICGRFAIRCFFLLQPLVTTKSPLTQVEQQTLADVGENLTQFVRDFYNGARLRLASKPNFIDLSHILDGRPEDDFYDLGHTGALTSPVIGGAIAARVFSRTVSQSSALVP